MAPTNVLQHDDDKDNDKDKDKEEVESIDGESKGESIDKLNSRSNDKQNSILTEE